jgi:hypothetical protein
MNKIKIKKYHTVGTMTISNIKIVERGKFDTLSTHIHDLSLYCLGTEHLRRKKSGGVNHLIFTNS